MTERQEEEIPQIPEETWKAICSFLDQLVEGKKCPHCHQPIEQKEQRGRCVYALPCEHRLYQGRLR